jgi:hypothetical protein
MQCEHCESPATFEYRWHWGQGGLVCEKHRINVTQKAEQLATVPQWIPLTPGRPDPMTRDERTQMYASVLALEDEVKDAKRRGLDLYNSNTQLANECQRLSSRNTYLEAQIVDAKADVEKVAAERDRLFDELAAARMDLDRIKAYMPTPTPQQQPTQPPAGG